MPTANSPCIINMGLFGFAKHAVGRIGHFAGAAVQKFGQLSGEVINRVGQFAHATKAAAGGLNSLTGGHLQSAIQALPGGGAALQAAGKGLDLLGSAHGVAKGVEAYGKAIQAG